MTSGEGPAFTASDATAAASLPTARGGGDLLEEALASLAREEQRRGLALLVLDAAEVQDPQRLGAPVDHVGPVVLDLRHGVLKQAEPLQGLQPRERLQVH